jgi:hypothetical protein
MANGMRIQSPTTKQVVKKFNGFQKDAETVLQRTVADFKSRAPAWVSAAVSETYGISKKEVKGAFTGAKKTAGSISAGGKQIDCIGLVYSGRVLTPLRFKMKPTKRPVRNRPYQVSAEIFKGQRKVLGSDIFLGSNKGGGYIPFQRKGDSRLPIESKKTVSIPQMIGNAQVEAQIRTNIDEGLSKRVEHHFNQVMKKHEQ